MPPKKVKLSYEWHVRKRRLSRLNHTSNDSITNGKSAENSGKYLLKDCN